MIFGSKKKDNHERSKQRPVEFRMLREFSSVAGDEPSWLPVVRKSEHSPGQYGKNRRTHSQLTHIKGIKFEGKKQKKRAIVF